MILKIESRFLEGREGMKKITTGNNFFATAVEMN